VPRGLLVKMAFKEPQVFKDYRVLLVKKELQVFKDYRVLLVKRVL
jgi:hypothetical protein